MFHVYGLILGIATALAFLLIEKKGKQVSFPPDCVWKVGLAVLVGGVFGARLWHVATDFHLYKNNLQGIIYIWQGGLSILGGIVGGGVGLYFAPKLFSECRKYSPAFLADLAVFGLPLAQVVGRIANWVNGELYGIPTNSPWKIYISPENRLASLANVAYYHPLFFYEMIVMAIFLLWIWLWHKKGQNKIGSGFFIWSYLSYYSFVRFFLDFIRLDKTLVFNWSLGVNQFVLAILIVPLVYIGIKKYLKSKLAMSLVFAAVILMWLGVFVGAAFPQQLDRIFVKQSSLPQLQIDDHVITVEVADSPAELQQGLSGREEIGADGMLFVFPQKIIPAFWMKEMQFDLDMIWIADGQVVEVTNNVPKPHPNTPLSELPRYSPKEPVTMVLEVPAGTADELGITAGSKIHFSYFKPEETPDPWLKPQEVVL